MPEETPGRKFFDVAPPGSSAPSPTSRPVIAKTAQPDPMMQKPSAFTFQPPAPEPAAPTPEAPTVPEPPKPAAHEPDPLPVDPGPLLIDAQQGFKPPRPTKSRAKQLVWLLVFAAVVAGLALGVYPLVRSKIL